MSQRLSGRIFLVAVAGVLALAATGCDGGDDAPTVASAAAASASSGVSEKKSEPDSEVARYVESQRKVVACLRKEGVDVPDPDAKGQVDFSVLGNWKQDPTASKAMIKCQPLGLPMPESLTQELEPEASAKERKQNQTYATCMQDNGAPDFPDIDEKGNFSDAQWNSTTAAAKHAEQVCYKKAYGVDLSTTAPRG
ncbi:hypothetical protein ACFV3E_44425 [Streptomyces sp. NPDC059718]